MDEKIVIHLFRRFRMVYKDQDILVQMNKSAKSISVLKYLILNVGKPIPVGELIDMFWDEDNGTNPENALKTLISRMRKALSQDFPELKNCIVTEKGTYQWSQDLPCDVDAFRFEEACQPLINAQAPLNDDLRRQFDQALGIYKGDVAAPFVTDEWIKGKSLYYHDLYLKTVNRYIELLRDEGSYDSIIAICRSALEIDSFDEALNLELMAALKETNQNNAALAHYRHSVDLHYKYLGIDPSDKILDFYKQLIKADLEAKDNLSVIRNKLMTETPDDAAFVCDYSIFRDIYQLQLRNAERWGVTMFLGLVMVENKDAEEDFAPFVLDNVMRTLLDILVGCLRKGDIVTRYSSSQFAVLLHMGTQDDGEVIVNRIKTLFYQSSIQPAMKLAFQIGPIRMEGNVSGYI